MFQTFTGSSRRPRNVNLSGRNTNPFAAAQAANARLAGGNQTPPTTTTNTSSSTTTTTSSTTAAPNAVAHAQNERRARQAERERAQAARVVQRVWKGYAARKRLAAELRDEWDKGADAGMSTDEAVDLDWEWELGRLKMLVRFVDRRDAGDVRRVCGFEGWLREGGGGRMVGVGRRKGEWAKPMGKLLRWTVRVLTGLPRGIETGERERVLRALMGLLEDIGEMFPGVVARQSREYYRMLGEVLVREILEDPQEHNVHGLVLLPLKDPSAYEGFVLELLVTPELDRYLDLEQLAKHLDLDALTRTTRRFLDARGDSRLTKVMPKSKMLWLLAYFVLFHHTSSSSRIKSNLNIAFTSTVCSLLSYLSDVLGQRPNIHNTQPQSDVPKFVRTQVETLINQDNIQSLLSSSQLLASGSTSDPRSEDAAVLASYALTLLQVFPRRGEDIRMWLYMGSMSKPDRGAPEPSIKFFWKAVRATKIYQDIYDDPKKAVQRLQSSRQNNDSTHARDPAESDWQKTLLFLELYSFVLPFMDDEQFMTGAEKSNSSQSWTGRSALAISDVIHLTIFLKHFAFAMYRHSSQIAESAEPVDGTSLASYFGHASAQAKIKDTASVTQSSEDVGFAGISGMTLSYMKGMVTGLLRTLYERDSRRNFTRNKDHWLMKEFHIEGFISAVVEEQAFKLEHQDDDSDDDDLMDEDSEDDRIQPILVGTHRTQNIRRIERLKKQQQRETRRKQLQTVTPRLEILQNMPFFIPFATRVEIFREFVHNDQLARREGFIDPDQWRMAQQHRAMTNAARARNELSKHMAKVRRDHIFEDAFEQFYELGEGLKEPIQITFVDQFDTPEAGIDGGGVTKEFLTSVTSEAFMPDNDFNLFVENSQHLLYPNPSALDEKKELMRETGVIREGSPEWNDEIRGLIRRYEFLGRVVGKCLYEGILVDIHFAPFFLVKWALTGGSGSATNESGYRAHMNDLRDLDEELYQGLLKLKNYPGNVEDFSLDFTVTDPVTSGPYPKLITRDLRPGGSSTPVTNQNRLIYVSSVARHRLQVQPFAQTQAFLRGLGSIIQPAWLSMFNQSELQTLLGGDAAEIDVDDLRANTLYGGVYAIGDDGREHPTVRDFWAVMKGLGDGDRRKVLKYVTSTPRGPLLGFGQLNPRFSIRDSGGDQSRLPSTSTCVNLLKLPIYRDPGVLREKLLYAVNSGAGFNLS